METYFTETEPGSKSFTFQGKSAFRKLEDGAFSIKLKNIHKFPQVIQRALLEVNGPDVKIETLDGSLEVPSWLVQNMDAYALKIAVDGDKKIDLSTDQLRQVVKAYTKVIKGESLTSEELRSINLVDLDFPTRLNSSYRADPSLVACRNTRRMQVYLAFSGLLETVSSPPWLPEPNRQIQERKIEFSQDINKVTRGRVWTTGNRCGGEIEIQPGHPLYGKTMDEMNDTPLRAHYQWTVCQRSENGNWMLSWDYQDGDPNEYQPKNQRRTLDSLASDLNKVVQLTDSIRNFQKLFFIGRMFDLLNANERFFDDYGAAIIRTMEI